MSAAHRSVPTICDHRSDLAASQYVYYLKITALPVPRRLYSVMTPRISGLRPSMQRNGGCPNVRCVPFIMKFLINMMLAYLGDIDTAALVNRYSLSVLSSDAHWFFLGNLCSCLLQYCIHLMSSMTSWVEVMNMLNISAYVWYQIMMSLSTT